MNRYRKSILDCDTPKGKSFINSQNETQNIIERKFKVKLEKRKKKTEKFDAYIHKDGGLYGVCEIKTRPYFNRKQKQPCTFDLLKGSDYLITAEKLNVLKDQSEKLNIKSYIFINLPLEKKIVYIRVTDEKGNFLVKHEVRKTETFATCNDEKGKVYRLNAFVKYDESNWKCFSY